MKRIGNLYDKICQEDNIRLAIRNASKGKRHRRQVRRVLEQEDRAVEQIIATLRSGSYTPRPARTKIIRDGAAGKEREITIPAFYPDQIIQWAVMQVLEPVFMKGMYRYCCGSVPGRGGLAAKRYVERALKEKKSRYILKLDIRKFYPSVSHAKLKQLLAKRIKDKPLLALLGTIIDRGGPGLPIGFYSSQWFANFYLQEVDHYIKQELKIPYYVRYVDDMVLMGPNKRKLHRARMALQGYLSSNAYELAVKDNWQLWRKGTRPLDFVGYRFYTNRIRLRRRLFYRITATVRRIRERGLNIRRAGRFLSLMGWCKRIPFRRYYVERIRPILPKWEARRYISRWELRRAMARARAH